MLETESNLRNAFAPLDAPGWEVAERRLAFGKFIFGPANPDWVVQWYNRGKISFAHTLTSTPLYACYIQPKSRLADFEVEGVEEILGDFGLRAVEVIQDGCCTRVLAEKI